MSSPEGLKDKIIGVQVSTVHQVYVKKHLPIPLPRSRNTEHRTRPIRISRPDASTTQADALALETFAATDAEKVCCETKGKVRLSGGPQTGCRCRLAQGDTRLEDNMNAAYLGGIRANGKYGEI